MVLANAGAQVLGLQQYQQIEDPRDVKGALEGLQAMADLEMAGANGEGDVMPQPDAD